jgi:hypothetical protein
MKTKNETTMQDPFLEILPAAELAPEIAANDDLYGWLIGSWDLRVVFYDEAGKTTETDGEAHFTRILEGRAVQDLFINPRRADRGTGMPEFPGNWFGTTLRMYDPTLRAWRVNWFNPRDGLRAELIGRRDGPDIIQTGTFPDGSQIRWSFIEITEDSFHWLGELYETATNTWRLQAEMFGSRV